MGFLCYVDDHLPVHSVIVTLVELRQFEDGGAGIRTNPSFWVIGNRAGIATTAGKQPATESAHASRTPTPLPNKKGSSSNGESQNKWSSEVYAACGRIEHYL